ncbi:MAG: carboxypeptidase regulatory-like domain-containing protein [Thermodesulfovibrionales bacterium]|nr:carboxypeptidase regulatory-like domain-containing protein [Thermodesulfovibrionales bacterium]
MNSAKNFNSKIKTTRIFGMRNGFTLIELVIVMVLIGILAAGAVMMFGNVVTQQRFDETIKEMNNLKMAMLGNPEMTQSGARSSFGFVGDIGALPSTLTPLVEKGALPSRVTTFTYDPSVGVETGTGAGWLGPYIDDKKDGSGNYLALLDGWGTAYTYNNATGQITSYGPNGVSGGGDDITIPETSIAGLISGGVAGQVRGNQGSPVEGVTVTIYYPNGAGTHTTQSAITDSNGRYTFNNIPIGRRTIKVVSGTLTMSDTAVVDGGQTQTKDFVIADMIAPAAPTWANAIGNCTVSGGYPVKTNQINLTWNASTSPDVAGYKIYRGTTSGGEVLYRTNITGTSYVDSVTANTTYYYRISAVDTAGNESSLATEIGPRVAGPIYKTANASWNNDEVRFPTTNSGISNIAMTKGVYQMIVTWSGGASTTIKEVKVGGTTVYKEPGAGCLGAANGAAFTINNASYTYNCGDNRDIKVRFCLDNDTATPVTVQLGGAEAPFDGELNCTGGPKCQ